MKSVYSILVVLFFAVFQVGAQITEGESKLKKVETVASDTLKGWKVGGVSGLNFAQTAMVNWAAGGENSLAMNGLLGLYANYKDTINTWDNTLDVGYGLLKQSSYKNGFMKTDDRIDFSSKYGRKAFKNFYYAALLNFKTQFSPGYNYPNDSVMVSNFLAPAYLLGAVGLNYQPNSYFNAFFAPITGKMTIVNDTALSNRGAYGVTPGKKIRGEFGGYMRFVLSKNDFKGEFMKNISFVSKLDLFSNYLHNPQNIDVNWENLIAMKVNKFISVNINTIMIYDDDIKILQKDGRKSPKLQFKEIFGVGFSYNFQ